PAPKPADSCRMLLSGAMPRAALTCLRLLLLVSADRFQLEAVKKEILERLGMPAPPAIRQRPDPESIQRAQRLYRRKVAELAGNRSRDEEEAGEEEAEFLSLTSAVTSGHREPLGPYRYHLLLSRTADFHRQLRVVRAELKLLKQPLSPPGASVPPRVTISTVPGAGGAPQLLHSQELPRDSRSLDLTGAIQPWLAGPEPSLRLQLEFSSDISAALAASAGETLELEMQTLEEPPRAARRARGLEEECGKSDGRCCLKSLRVSFQDIGWADWVIAPNSYHMRFCEGSCPHNYKPASMHAQIQSRVHSLSKAAPPPCCVPAGYDPMVLMHLDSQGRLVSSLFEDMLVTRCHCA
uniref:Uncharacterized protein n=1 Tax=Geospiza parvula TaxID=87175 RepID=A0A8C3QD43_GEOPR